MSHLASRVIPIYPGFFSRGSTSCFARPLHLRLGRSMAVSSSASSTLLPAPSAGTVRLAVVGDVHGQWHAADVVALQHLEADCALFVGDIGEEDLELVGAIADMDHPKAVILGNHDAWWSLTKRGLSRRLEQWPAGATAESEASRDPDAGARAQMAILQARQCDVGFSALPLPQHRISIVGGRPFSKGGNDWKSIARFNRAVLGVESMAESAVRIAEVGMAQPLDHDLVMLAHNGPLGNGRSREDISGIDFTNVGGDHGDPDLAVAIADMKARDRRVPLCIFGHMHSSLNSRFGSGTRKMCHISDGTCYVNAATVPRIRKFKDYEARHFCVVEMTNGLVVGVRNVWVQVDESTGACRLHKEEILFPTVPSVPLQRLSLVK